MQPKQDTLRQILSGGMTQSELMNRTEEEQILEMIEMFAKLMGQGEALGIGHSPTTARPDTMYMPEYLNRLDIINSSTMPESGLRNILLGLPIYEQSAHDSIDSLINSDASGLRNLLLGRDIR